MIHYTNYTSKNLKVNIIVSSILIFYRQQSIEKILYAADIKSLRTSSVVVHYRMII